MRAPANKIIPLSVVDGPGNRTSIFLQKCNIACAYCHNPETQRMCIGCGICVDKCPVQALTLKKGAGEGRRGAVIWDETKCIQCDNCIRVCPYSASPKIRYMEASEVFEQVSKNIPFIRGITVSGGECTLYPEFLTELFELVKTKGLTCYIDSNGCTDFSRYPELMKYCDKVMLDVKAWDKEVFYRLTQGENDIVKKNLVYLAEEHKLEEVRIVCLEPEVDVEATIRGIAENVEKYLNQFTLKLIAFRNHGVSTKLKDRETPSYEKMREWERIAGLCGFSNIRIV